MLTLQIPKKLHIIWVGGTNKRPDANIETWRGAHPGWEFKLWGDAELQAGPWLNQQHLDTFIGIKKWPAVADLMRYEILHREGGVYVDADSRCVRPLDDWLLASEFFACWEDTLGRERRVNNAFIGTKPGNEFLLFVVKELRKRPQLLKRWSWSRMRYVKMGAWRSVGPHFFSKCLFEYQGEGYRNASILPSHFFSPHHFRRDSYTGGGLVYADHGWSSTKKTYGKPEDMPGSGGM